MTKASAQETIYTVIDVELVTRYYKLQSSTLAKPSKPTTMPPSGWMTIEPTYTDGSTNNLYFVDCTVFNNSTFKYSEVSLSSSYEAAKAAYNKAKSAIEIADGITMSVTNGIPGNKASIILKVGDKEYSGTIDLTGTVTFSDLSTAGKTSINGGNITTSSVTTDKIAVGAITADKITSGTITADKLNIDDIFSKNITATGQIQFKNKKYEFSINPNSDEITIKSFSEMLLNGSPIRILSDSAWISLSAMNGISLEYASGDITINQKPLKSFIVESGTSGIWRYHKYSDGTCELWGRKTITSLAISTAIGSWYRSSSGQQFGSYPFSVYNSSITTGFESTNGQSALTWASTDSSNTGPYNVYLMRPTSSSSVSGILSIHVRGKLTA